MRSHLNQKQQLGEFTSPADLSINLKSRHEMTPLLQGLKFVFCDDELRQEALQLVSKAISNGKKATGRHGLSYWEILVMGVIRLGLDANYDCLLDLCNNHLDLRIMLGIHNPGPFTGKGHQYHFQTIHDNVTKIDEQTLAQLNVLLVKAGQKVLKKKTSRKKKKRAAQKAQPGFSKVA